MEGSERHARSDLRHIVLLALPVVAAELGWFAMSVIDTLMVGPLGPTAIAAVSIGGAVFEFPGLAAFGLLLGLDTVVSQSFGAGRRSECNNWLWNGVYLALALAAPGVLAVAALALVLSPAGVHAEIVAAAGPYIGALKWSLPPLLIYAALRRYLQAMGLVRPVMFVLLSANIVNVVGNWILIGPFGLAGVAWSTVFARIYMAAALAGIALLNDSSVARPLRMESARLRRLIALGGPAAGQLVLEIGVFAGVTALAGRLNPRALAAHYIALNVAATTFMVPLGISSASAVVVGQAVGRKDIRGARRAGWHSIALGAGFMLAAAMLYITLPGLITGAFTTDAELLRIVIPLMYIAAIFAVFDGTQVVAIGVLRGAGDTRTPMIASLLAYWLIGLPSGYALCFTLGLGVTGLWLGMCAGLITAATLLLSGWMRLSAGAAPGLSAAVSAVDSA